MEKLIEKANNNLRLIFGTRHDKPITTECIEQVYSRQQLGIEADAKTRKGSSNGYLTGVLYLAPANVSGVNTCPAASEGCREACLFTAGRGVMYPVFRARIAKTLAFYSDKPRYINTLQESIRKLKVKAKNKNMIPVVRLNGTSDILWDKITNLIQDNSDIQFYDYTKFSKRFEETLPANYDLTFSLSEDNLDKAKEVLANGGKVAAVFREELPETFLGFEVINGDKTDLRFTDKPNVVVGLKAKGKAKQDQSGFVQDTSLKAA